MENKRDPRWSIKDIVHPRREWFDEGGRALCNHKFGGLRTRKKSGKVTMMYWKCGCCHMKRRVLL